MRLSSAAALALLIATACSADEAPDFATPSGGAGASGGSQAVGAAGASSSGAGGAVSSSGAAGAPVAGGQAGAAGMSGTGGTVAGGAGGGAAGAAQAGQGGGGGAAASAGCAKQQWPASKRYTIQSGGKARDYVLDVPDDYDSKKPYRLVFGWHWRGGNADNVVKGSGNASRGPYYGLKALASKSAIFVAPEGLVDDGVTGWANPNGRDITFLSDLLTQLKGELCIDQDRIFSTGFSYGGMMSIAVGCAMGNVFRAVAPMAGAAFSGCADGTAPVAFLGTHAPGDGVVGIDEGRSARDTFLSRNGCGSQTHAVEPSQCLTYEGCKAGYPVTWCEFSGDHFTPDFAPQTVWSFFSQF